MLMENLTIGNNELTVKEYEGQRVVTFKDIDMVHERPEGTARKRFNDNKKHFIEGVDFFKITPSVFRTAIGEMDIRQQNDITLLTESGYLMVVKSLKDDLAWEVQRQLVNSYFRLKEITAVHKNELSINISSLAERIDKMEILLDNQNQISERQTWIIERLAKASKLVYDEQKDVTDKLYKLIKASGITYNLLKKFSDEGTINKKQQDRIQHVARKRVNKLLGGAHSLKYKENSRRYFSNLWNDFRDKFEVGSYRDLHPKDFEKAVRYLGQWDYIDY